MSTSVKISEKKLQIQRNFSTILLPNCYNFRFKNYERPWDYQNYSRNEV